MVTFRNFRLFFDFPPSLITRSQAIVAEGVEALCQDRVLSFHLRNRGGQDLIQYKVRSYHLAGWAGQGLFILPDLLLENLIHVGSHLNLLQALDLPL